MAGVWREPAHSKPPPLHQQDATAAHSGKDGAQTASASAPHRKRPFIYVYDLPAEFNTKLVQQKNNPGVCNWRRFSSNK